jgi:hypothetical protein
LNDKVSSTALRSFMKSYFFICFVIFLSVACSSKKAQKNKLETKVRAKDTVESFQSFNVKFHADSFFQISRIAFPIGGKYIDGSDQHGWTKQNWKQLKSPVGAKVDTSQYKYRLIKTDSSVTEKFWIDQSGFNIERRFKLKKDKWYLIYFNDVNL